jgi:hypothetical protein
MPPTHPGDRDDRAKRICVCDARELLQPALESGVRVCASDAVGEWRRPRLLLR